MPLTAREKALGCGTLVLALSYSSPHAALEFLVLRCRDLLWAATCLITAAFVFDRLDSWRSSSEARRSEGLRAGNLATASSGDRQPGQAAATANRRRRPLGADWSSPPQSSSVCLKRVRPMLPSCTCDAAGHLIDILLRDYINAWFGGLSADGEFPAMVQDAMCHAIGEFLVRCKQRLNPVEFALQHVALLVKHHLALYTAARRAAALRHPKAFPQGADNSTSSGGDISSSSSMGSSSSSSGNGAVAGGRRGGVDMEALARRREAAPRTCLGATGVGAPGVPLSTVEGYEPTTVELSKVEACHQRSKYILEELVRAGSLHPAFTFGTDSSTSTTSEKSSTGVPVVPEINPPGTKPSLPELAYLRFVCSLLVKKLLDEPERSSSLARSIARELIVSTVLCPVVNLVSSDNLNHWILLGFRASRNGALRKAQAAAAKEKADAEKETAEDDGGGNGSAPVDKSEATAAVTATSTTATKTAMDTAVDLATQAAAEAAAEAEDEARMAEWAPTGIPPVAFRPTADVTWRHLAGAYDGPTAEVILSGEPHGTFLLRKCEPHPSHLASSDSSSAKTRIDSNSSSSSSSNSSGSKSGSTVRKDASYEAIEASSYALSYVAPSDMGRSASLALEHSSSSHGISNAAAAAAAPRVVHVLIRATPPNCFEYLGTAPAEVGASTWHDPRLVERGAYLLDPFASLAALVEALDDLATRGLEFEPDPQSADAQYWASLVAAAAVQPPQTIETALLPHDTETEIAAPVATRTLSSAATARVGRLISSEFDDDDEDGDEESSEDEDGNLDSPAVGSTRTKGVLSDNSDESSLRSSTGAAAVAEGEEGGEGEATTADETSLFEEQQRHVLLIELQAAVENAEDYYRRCSELRQTAAEHARARKKFSSSSSSSSNAAPTATAAAARALAMAPWHASDGIALMARVVVALDAVFSHGLATPPPPLPSELRLLEGYPSSSPLQRWQLLPSSSQRPMSRPEPLSAPLAVGGAQAARTEELPLKDDGVGINDVDHGKESSTEQPWGLYHLYLFDQSAWQAASPRVVSSEQRTVSTNGGRSRSAELQKTSSSLSSQAIAGPLLERDALGALSALETCAPLCYGSSDSSSSSSSTRSMRSSSPSSSREPCVDLAGRAWFAAALKHGLLKDRCYEKLADPRRTRDFYRLGALLREPNDSSRLMWLLERLSELGLASNQSGGGGGNRSSSSHNGSSANAGSARALQSPHAPTTSPTGPAWVDQGEMPILSVLVQSLALTGHRNLALRAEAIAQEHAARTSSQPPSSSSSFLSSSSSSSLFKSALKTIDSALTFSGGPTHAAPTRNHAMMNERPASMPANRSSSSGTYDAKGPSLPSVQPGSSPPSPGAVVRWLPPPGAVVLGPADSSTPTAAAAANGANSNHQASGPQGRVNHCASCMTALSLDSDSLKASGLTCMKCGAVNSWAPSGSGGGGGGAGSNQRSVSDGGNAAADPGAARGATTVSMERAVSNSLMDDLFDATSRTMYAPVAIFKKATTSEKRGNLRKSVSSSKGGHKSSKHASGSSEGASSHHTPFSMNAALAAAGRQRTLLACSRVEQETKAALLRAGNDNKNTSLQHGSALPPSPGRHRDANNDRGGGEEGEPLESMLNAAAGTIDELWSGTVSPTLQAWGAAALDAPSNNNNTAANARSLEDELGGDSLLPSSTHGNDAPGRTSTVAGAVEGGSPAVSRARHLAGLQRMSDLLRHHLRSQASASKNNGNDRYSHGGDASSDSSGSPPGSDSSNYHPGALAVYSLSRFYALDPSSLEPTTSNNSTWDQTMASFASDVVSAMANGSSGVGSPTAAVTLVPLQEVYLIALECTLRAQREAELLTLETSDDRRNLRRRAVRLVGFLLRPRDRPSKSALSAAHVLRQNGASVQASVVLTEEDAAFAAAKNARHQAQAQSGRGDMVSEAMHSLKEAGGSLAASAAASAAATLDMGLALGHSAPVTYTVSVVKTNLEARVQARWTVHKRYTDFRALHKALLSESRQAAEAADAANNNNSSTSRMDRHGSSSSASASNRSLSSSSSASGVHQGGNSSASPPFSSAYALPPLPPKRTLGNTERDFVASRKHKLGVYLAALLNHRIYGNSHEVLAFLEALPDPDPDLASTAKINQVKNGNSSGIGTVSQRSRSGSVAMVLPRRLGDSRQWTPLKESTSGGVSTAHGNSEAAAFDGGAVPFPGSDADYGTASAAVGVSPLAASEDPRAMDDVSLQRIQSHAYAILKEVLELDQRSLFRRNLLSFLRKAVKVMFTGTISKALSKLQQRFSSDDTTASFVSWIVGVVWSAPGWRRPPVPIPPPTAEVQAARCARLRDEFLGAVPGPLESLLGTATCADATLKCHEFLQCGVLIRSLVYSTLDLLWRQLFPDEPALQDLYGMDLEWDDSMQT